LEKTNWYRVLLKKRTDFMLY
jgi:hypothetical protein